MICILAYYLSRRVQELSAVVIGVRFARQSEWNTPEETTCTYKSCRSSTSLRVSLTRRHLLGICKFSTQIPMTTFPFLLCRYIRINPNFILCTSRQKQKTTDHVCVNFFRHSNKYFICTFHNIIGMEPTNNSRTDIVYTYYSTIYHDTTKYKLGVHQWRKHNILK